MTAPGPSWLVSEIPSGLLWPRPKCRDWDNTETLLKSSQHWSPDWGQEYYWEEITMRWSQGGGVTNLGEVSVSFAMSQRADFHPMPGMIRWTQQCPADAVINILCIGRGEQNILAVLLRGYTGPLQSLQRCQPFLLQFGMELFSLPESIVLGHGDCKDRRGRMICEGEPCK